MSTGSVIPLWIACISGLLALLQPKLWEIGLLFGIEFLLIGLLHVIDGKLYPRIFPDVKPYFPVTDAAAIYRLPIEEKVKVYDSLVKFPLRRAIHCTAFTALKTVAELGIVLFVWTYERSMLDQAARYMLYSCIIYLYFYCAHYIEAHTFVSKLLIRFHHENDWSDVFRRAPVSYSKREFHIQENVGLTGIALFILVYQASAVLSWNPQLGVNALCVEILAIGLMGFILMARIWVLSRNYVLESLEQVFAFIINRNSSNSDKLLPLHSSQLIAGFEQTYNQLIDRLRNHELEMANWVHLETEKNRYRTLGELSGLIAHDLSTPLHVMHFCVQQLAEDPDKARDTRYVQQLLENCDKSYKLVTALKSYMKNPKDRAAGCKLGEAHANAVKLLSTQYSPFDLARIEITFSSRLEDHILDISQTELIHVLFNLYSNAIRSVLERSDETCRSIKVDVADETHWFLTFSVSDSGTGLTKERFERMTAFGFSQSSKQQFQEGLGLRLVRRLVELNRGSLAIGAPPAYGGTTLLLRLPFKNTAIELNKLEHGK